LYSKGPSFWITFFFSPSFLPLFSLYSLFFFKIFFLFFSFSLFLISFLRFFFPNSKKKVSLLFKLFQRLFVVVGVFFLSLTFLFLLSLWGFQGKLPVAGSKVGCVFVVAFFPWVCKGGRLTSSKCGAKTATGVFFRGLAWGSWFNGGVGTWLPFKGVPRSGSLVFVGWGGASTTAKDQSSWSFVGQRGVGRGGQGQKEGAVVLAGGPKSKSAGGKSPGRLQKKTSWMVCLLWWWLSPWVCVALGSVVFSKTTSKNKRFPSQSNFKAQTFLQRTCSFHSLPKDCEGDGPSFGYGVLSTDKHQHQNPCKVAARPARPAPPPPARRNHKTQRYFI